MVKQGICGALPRTCRTVLPCKAILLSLASVTVSACKPMLHRKAWREKTRFYVTARVKHYTSLEGVADAEVERVVSRADFSIVADRVARAILVFYHCVSSVQIGALCKRLCI